MQKILLIACALCGFMATAAIAENWMKAGDSYFQMYDADSVYVETATGLIYVTQCSALELDKLVCDSERGTIRFDCKRQTSSFYDDRNDDRDGWSTRSVEPRSDEGQLFLKLCTSVNTLPRR